jgi:cell division septation protein DedD
VTDGKGQYAFRNLPAGRYTIVARRDGRENSAAVSVPEGPAVVKDVDVTVLQADVPADGIGALLESLAGQSTTPAQAGDERLQGLFTIEVAESASLRHARAMADELKNAGHAAYVETAASGVDGPYRVRVGRYSSLAAANRSARGLEKALGWRVSVTAVPSGSVVARGNAGSGVR